MGKKADFKRKPFNTDRIKMRIFIYKLIFIFALASAPFAKAELASTDRPIFSDDSPFAVKLLSDKGWVSPFLSVYSMNPERKATIPEFFEFRLKENTKSTYESDKFDNVMFLNVHKNGILSDLNIEGYIVQATLKENNITYYILIKRAKLREMTDKSPNNIFETKSFEATSSYLAGKLQKTVKVEDISKYFKNSTGVTVTSLYEKEIKQYLENGRPVPSYDIFFTTKLADMEKFRSQATEYVLALRGEESHQAKIDGWAKYIRPELFKARILPICQKMKGVTGTTEEISGQLSDRLGVGRIDSSLYAGLQVSMNDNECSMRSGVRWTTRISIYSIDFTGCTEGDCTVVYELACHGNACGDVRYRPEKARVFIQGRKAEFIGLID